MILTIPAEAQETVVNIFEPQYQPYVIAAFSFMPVAIGLYFAYIKPKIEKSSANQELLTLKQEFAAFKEQMPNKDEMNAMVNEQASNFDILRTKKDIADLEFKLPFANTDEEKIRIQTLINELKASINA